VFSFIVAVLFAIRIYSNSVHCLPNNIVTFWNLPIRSSTDVWRSLLRGKRFLFFKRFLSPTFQRNYCINKHEAKVQTQLIERVLETIWKWCQQQPFLPVPGLSIKTPERTVPAAICKQIKSCWNEQLNLIQCALIHGVCLAPLRHQSTGFCWLMVVVSTQV